jgi:voltage-gated potassium channel
MHVPRSFERFLTDPRSLRHATAAIISVTVAMVVIGAVLIRLFDADDYPSLGSALWFMLQTVTTVGYGDNTPTSMIGRAVASVVMLVAIGLITVVTAVVTSLFIQAAQQRVGDAHATDDADTMARVEASLASISKRLDRIEASMSGDQRPERASSDTDR